VTYEQRVTHSAAAIPSAFISATPSTLGSAASQSAPVVVAPPARRSVLVWLAPAVVVGAIAAGVAVARHPSSDTTSTLVVAADASKQGSSVQAGSESVTPEHPSTRSVPPGSLPHVATSQQSASSTQIAAIDAGARTADTEPPVFADAGARVPSIAPSAPADASLHDAAVESPAPSPAAAPAISTKPASRPLAPPAPSHSRVPSSAAPPVTVATGEPGELVILVNPWATIWINNKQAGTTPFRKTLPSGKYLVRLSNDDLDKNETVTLTVEPNKPTTLRRNW
jgi:hypothetical protein